MKTTMYCALAALALLAAPASAQSFAQLHQGHARGTDVTLTEIGGLVDFNGTILGGHGFTVVHNKKGVYTITYPAGAWGTGLPAATCSAAGTHGVVATCDVYDQEPDASRTTVIHLYSIPGLQLVNNAFSFTAVLEH